MYKEIAVCTICKICYLLSLPLSKLQEQMTVLGRFGLHICITFWVELNAIKIHMLQSTFFVAVAAYIQHSI